MGLVSLNTYIGPVHHTIGPRPDLVDGRGLTREAVTGRDARPTARAGGGTGGKIMAPCVSGVGVD